MKRFVIFLSIMLFSAVVFGQQQNWSAGAYGLAGMAKLTYGDNVAQADYQFKGAYQIGLFGQYTPNQRIAWRVGLLYAVSNSGYTGRDPSIYFPDYPPMVGDTYKGTARHTDLLLPLEMLIDFSKRPGGLYLVFGPALGFKLDRYAEETTYLVGGDSFSHDLTQGRSYPSVDLFGSVGLGYAFSLGGQFSAFVQPWFTSNIPGNIFEVLGNSKGGHYDYITTYVYGVQLGVARGF